MIYYLDYLNSGIVNDGNPANLASTVRLYNSIENKLLLIAPYTQAPEITVQHEWTAASKSIAGALAKGKKEGLEFANEIMKALSAIAKEVDDNYYADPSFSSAFLSAADAMKSFKGTSITNSLMTISTTIMSDAKSIKSIGLVPKLKDDDPQPLKKYLLELNKVFVGKNSWDSADKDAVSGTSKDAVRGDQDKVENGSNVGKVEPPNGFSCDPVKFKRKVTGSFYIVAGDNNMVIRGLLLKSYKVKTSKLLTINSSEIGDASSKSGEFNANSGDFYYANIELTFELGRYMLKSDLDSWIT